MSREKGLNLRSFNCVKIATKIKVIEFIEVRGNPASNRLSANNDNIDQQSIKAMNYPCRRVANCLHAQSIIIDKLSYYFSVQLFAETL